MPPTPNAQRIAAENIRRLAAEKRINQTTLGRAINVTQPGLSRRLLGRIAFSIDELEALARVLDVELSELITAEQPAAS